MNASKWVLATFLGVLFLNNLPPDRPPTAAPAAAPPPVLYTPQPAGVLDRLADGARNLVNTVGDLAEALADHLEEQANLPKPPGDHQLSRHQPPAPPDVPPADQGREGTSPQHPLQGTHFQESDLRILE
ncbi:MAG: hypothetical protein KDI06_03420 [Calditrichaeota bacterium]|nr:hypothetical protein [Calditrichota bacterium]